MLFRNYAKPGKGVNKRDPNQPRYQIFFEILPRNLWRLVKLSILYLLVALPFFAVTMIAMRLIFFQITNVFSPNLSGNLIKEVFLKYSFQLRFVMSFWFTAFYGQGPITAGLTYIVREYGKEKPCWIISDFFERIRLNFKQGLFVWILDLVIVCCELFAILYYIDQNMYIFVAVIFCIIFVYTLAHIYIYQIMITYNMKLRDIFKNSIFLAVGKLPQSVAIFMFLIISYIVFPVIVTYYGNGILFFVMIAIETLLLPALSAFVVNFCIYPTLKKICG